MPRLAHHFIPCPTWEDAHKAAVAAYHALEVQRRLVLSHHWASEGYWLEFPPYTPLCSVDIIELEYPPTRC